jgi:hypothetical protein
MHDQESYSQGNCRRLAELEEAGGQRYYFTFLGKAGTGIAPSTTLTDRESPSTRPSAFQTHLVFDVRGADKQGSNGQSVV